MVAREMGRTDRELVERDAELGRLRELIARTREGVGALVVVEGPPGIGKTRLLERARAMAAEAGFTRLRARAGELERDFSYGVVRQLFDPWLREASDAERDRMLHGPAAPARPALGLEADGAAAHGADAQFAVMHGLYWLVGNLAAERPLLLEIDDLQSVDPPTLRFLAYLVTRLDGLQILVAVASRPPEPGAPSGLLETVRADPVAVALRPAPLSPAGTCALVEAILGVDEPIAAFVDACRQATGGNPYYLRELLDALRQDGIEPDAAGAERARSIGPQAVVRALLLRLARLPPAAERLAHAVAVFGTRADLAHAAELAELSPEAALDAADALAAASIFDAGRPLRFLHPIVREAIYASLRPAQRVRMHRQAARILQRAGTRADEIAPQLLATDPAADPEVVALLREAARTALEQGAPDAASRHLQRALREPPPADQRAGVLAELGESELRVGAYEESARVLGEAIELEPDPLQRARLVLLRVYPMLPTAGPDGVIAMLEQALADVGDDGGELALLLLTELCAQLVGSSRTGHPALERLGAFAAVEGRTRAERRALALLAMQDFARGRDAQACAELARRAFADGRFVAEETSTSVFYFFVLLTLVATESIDDVRRVADAGLADVERRGAIFARPGLDFARTRLELLRGDLPAAEEHAHRCVRRAIPSMRGTAASILALVRLEQGDVEGAERTLVEAGLEGAPAQWRSGYWLGPYVRGRVRLARGRAAAALADFEAVGARVAVVGGPPAGTPWGAYAALARAALGDDEGARREAAAELARAEGWGLPWRTGLALRVLGHVAPADERLAWLRRAEATLAASPARLEHARTLLDLGVALAGGDALAAGADPDEVPRRAGGADPDAGRAVLRRAVDVARACGAHALVGQAHEALRATGARPRTLTFSGPESLTARERRVAELAATGMSNREIAEELVVTAKTVENHLGRVYGKLGISSRAELRDRLPAPD